MCQTDWHEEECAVAFQHRTTRRVEKGVFQVTAFLIVCIVAFAILVQLGEKHRVLTFVGMGFLFFLIVGLFALPCRAYERQYPIAGVTATMFTMQHNALLESRRDDSDVRALAHLIYAEGNTLGEEGMLYVGSVVLNRVSNPYYPDTIQGVIFDKGQYACIDDGHYFNEPSARAYELAEVLIEEGSVLPDYVLYQSEFVQGGVYAHVGNTYFCYQRKDN